MLRKLAALYAGVSTAYETTVNQLLDLRQMVQQRGYEVVEEYIDHGISGAKARRPALDKMMADARRGQFDIVVVWAIDRLARSVKHFVEVIAELERSLIIERVKAGIRRARSEGRRIGRRPLTLIVMPYSTLDTPE